MGHPGWWGLLALGCKRCARAAIHCVLEGPKSATITRQRSARPVQPSARLLRYEHCLSCARATRTQRSQPLRMEADGRPLHPAAGFLATATDGPWSNLTQPVARFSANSVESQLSHTRPADVPGDGQAPVGVRGRKPWSGGVSSGRCGRTWTPLDPLCHLAKVEVASSNLVIRSTQTPLQRGFRLL
jgi:hypothetical protein